MMKKVVLALITVFAIGGVLFFSPFTVSLRFGPKLADTLLLFTLPDGAAQISPVTTTNQDGTLPGMAQISFDLPGAPGQARAHFEAQCTTQGFLAPDPSTLSADPTAVCVSTSVNPRQTLAVIEKCSAAPCRVDLILRSISF